VTSPEAAAAPARATPAAARVDAGALGSWVVGLLATVGYRDEGAAFVADTLLDANLRGVDSHGVMRLPVYLARIEAGLVDPAATPHVERHGAVAHVDARGAPGQLATLAALEAVVELANEFGVGCAAVRGSAHFGTAGFYARWLAERGCIGMVVSNSESIVVPHGGAEAVLGTNPIALAAPHGDRPLSLDMATSAGAMGKVMVIGQRGQQIPLGWGVDRDGHETVVPADVHALLPLGGAKGYGLGVWVEVLAGVLTGAAMGHDIGNMYRDFDRPQDVGHFVLALHIGHFPAGDAFGSRLARLATMLTGSRPAPGSSEVMLPGEPEERVRRERSAQGVPIEAGTLDELRALGAARGVPFPPTLSAGEEATG
jgi:ureidoglycolate dehydrogenase (NAD+)